MKMNKFFMSLCAAAAIFGFASCSEDDLSGGKENGNQVAVQGEGVYLSVNVQMPKAEGSRSQTTENGQSNDGTEVGSAGENAVNSVLIVLAKSTKNENNNAFIAAGIVQKGASLVPNSTTNTYKATAKITKTVLNTYYTRTLGPGKYENNLVNLYVFCNPTKDLQEIIFGDENSEGLQLGDTDWLQATCNVVVAAKNTHPIWTANSFLMNNAEIAQRELPAGIDAWDSYKTEASAFDFSGLNGSIYGEINNSPEYTGRGNVRVERAVARFDFKDGSELGNNTYEVYKRAGEDNTVIPLVDVQLDRMVLVNMCNKFYYLPRVSDNGRNTGATICGNEYYSTSSKTGNYVVGPYANEYAANPEQSAFQDPNGYGKFMNYPLFNVKNTASNTFTYNFTEWDATYYISDVLKDQVDINGEVVNKDNYGDKSYHVWRYVTENVIPADPSKQQNGITTAVVFRGRMIPTENLNNSDKYDKALYDALNGTGLTSEINDPILYSYNNILYCGFEAVQHAVLAATITFTDATNTTPKFEDVEIGDKTVKRLVVNRADPFYQAVFGNGAIGKFTWNNNEYEDTGEADDITIDQNCADYKWHQWDKNRSNQTLYSEMAAAMIKQGFTLYQSSEQTVDGKKIRGYFCHYFYWNRHNDNGDNGDMGSMEFATVRNNVYKLSISKISRLGHPRKPENDPDSPTPDTPDESSDLYFTVNCEVLPWVVRVNNIEF